MSDKIGRNDPCPCGSGKKCKKCCWGVKELEPAGFDSEPDIFDEDSDGAPYTSDLHPYVLARMADRVSDDVIEKVVREMPDIRLKMAARWTPQKVSILSTKDIVERLRRLDIDASPGNFLALARDRFSAWDIGEQWADGLKKEFAANETDFICLAACELWKRYCPERPSMEMLDDWMQEGYDFDETRQTDRALEIWLKIWDVLMPRFTPMMKRLDDTRPIFKGYQCLFNWVQDVELALLNATRSDRKWIVPGIQFLEGVLRHFPEDYPSLAQPFQGTLGHLYFRNGRKDRGEEIFQGMINEHPRHGAGYVYWADTLTEGDIKSENRARAIELLEKALAMPVEDGEDWDLKDRLDRTRLKNEA